MRPRVRFQQEARRTKRKPRIERQPHPSIVIQEEACIPGWVADLESFRRWARSDDYPSHGWFSYLKGELWVDLSMEQLLTHNQVKTQYTIQVGGLVRTEKLGYFYSDRTLLSNPLADLSTEPDGLFFFWETLRSGRIRMVPAKQQGYVELEGTPDIVLEMVGPTSVRKDTEVLRDLYWRAGIPEYWLVDALGELLRFDILRYTARGYVASRRQNGWVRSGVFGKSFQLTEDTDPLGHPLYTLAIRS